jgi:hypothetical protein
MMMGVSYFMGRCLWFGASSVEMLKFKLQGVIAREYRVFMGGVGVVG